MYICLVANLLASNIFSRMLKDASKGGSNAGDGPIYVARWFHHLASLDFAQATVKLAQKAQAAAKVIVSLAVDFLKSDFMLCLHRTQRE